MKRIVNVDMVCRCKKLSTALDRFFKKYPSLDYWRECFEYMADHNMDSFNDTILADGTRNDNWFWALNLDIDDNYFYIAVIERA